MKTIHDVEGKPFRLFATVARDGGFRASRVDIRRAVRNCTQFIIRSGEEPITPTSWRCSIRVVRSRTEMTLGCHTFTGKDLAALRVWLKSAPKA